MNTKWLLAHADAPMCYALTRDASLTDRVLENDEVRHWLGRLTDRALRGDLSDMHGSHDYRYENIIGKCCVLGLTASVAPLDMAVRFYLRFLDAHIGKTHDGPLTFAKMYQYRDYETILACYLPLMGYAREPCVRYVAQKRARVVYEFTRRGRYDIYRADLPYPGVKKEWKPLIVDPALYADGNIALPSLHDLILFAGMYAHWDDESRAQAETAVGWIFGEGYAAISDGLCYYAPADPRYKAKAINSKVFLFDFDKPQHDPFEQRCLLFHCFVFSHFEAARQSPWFARALACLEAYRTPEGRYLFPRQMIVEQPDTNLAYGGHMNVGESKKNKQYAELISTYWMKRISDNFQ